MSDKLEELLEQEGFSIYKHETGYELEMYTPAGEDWIMGITNLDDFVEYANNFDPEEEFEMWIAADEDGRVYAHEKEPMMGKNSWESAGGVVSELPLLIDFGVDSWKDTKTRRPFNYWEYIGKCGIFSDNHSDAEVWGVLVAITEKGMFRSDKLHLFEKFRPLTDEEKGNLA